MTLAQLNYLLALDQHQHFAQAAQACFVTQPTLSMQLQKLEEELGVTLFDRSKKPDDVPFTMVTDYHPLLWKRTSIKR